MRREQEKETREQRQFRKNSVFTVGILLLCIFLTLLINYVNFQSKLHKIIQNGTTQSLMDSTKQSNVLIHSIIDQRIEYLKLMARFCESNTIENDYRITSLIAKENQRSEYESVILMSKDCTIYKGDKQPVNYKNNPIFQKALEQEGYISEVFTYEETGEESILVSALVYRAGEVNGAVASIYQVQYFTDLIGRSMYEDYGATLIVQRDGKVISGYEGLEEYDSFFSMMQQSGFEFENEMVLENLIQDIENGGSGVIQYSKNGNKRYVVYAPTNINGWMTVSLVMARNIDEQAIQINEEVVKLTILCVLIFVLLAFILFSIYGKHKQFSEDAQMNERFQIVARQTNAVIYDYNAQRKKVQFSRGINRIFGDAEEENYIEQIHKEDLYKLEEIKKDIQHKESFQKEIRISRENRNFEWYLLSGELVRNQKGNISRVVGRIENINDKKLEINQLMQMTKEDILTKVYNKAGLEKTVREILEAEKNHSGYAFYFIDIDDFKYFNDTYGHDVGDEVIITTSECIKNVFDNAGLVGRFGGDEFVVFAKRISSENEAKQYAEKLLHDIKVTNQYNIGLSIGIAICPDHGNTYEELMKHADLALYKAKAHGKNQSYIYQVDMELEKE